MTVRRLIGAAEPVRSPFSSSSRGGPRGLARARGGRERHGRHRPEARQRGRRRCAEGGRQRGGCGGRRRLRAGRDLSDGRQSRRRRLHDHPSQGRPLDLHRFSRARAGRATRDMYLDKDGNPVEGLSTDGYLAVGVPGSVAGFEYARERYGTRERPDLLAPAIKLAAEGFALSPATSRASRRATRTSPRIRGRRDLPETGGIPYAVGERLVQSDLAGTLRAISERGPDGFYGARRRRRSWTPPRRAAASSRPPTSKPTRCASWSPSAATTRATRSSPRRRRVRAASSSARS